MVNELSENVGMMFFVVRSFIVISDDGPSMKFGWLSKESWSELVVIQFWEGLTIIPVLLVVAILLSVFLFVF